MHRQTIRGLTTAAGIWATAGIGIAVGTGFYSVGVAATIIILIGQILLHGKIKLLPSPRTELIIVNITNQPGALRTVKEIIEKEDISIINLRTKSSKKSDELLDIHIIILQFEYLNLMILRNYFVFCKITLL